MLLLIATVPFIAPVVDEVDLVEVNHVYNDQGKHRFTQLIFYNYQRGYDADVQKRRLRYQVVDWRILKGRLPMPKGKKYETIFLDYGKIMRCVIARQYRETWTQYDVEQDERRHLPDRIRKGLTE
tara:strand:- start:1234 stop:1608 length:375 start_codon:yes stop_codon:yes gene_type:complete